MNKLHSFIAVAAFAIGCGGGGSPPALVPVVEPPVVPVVPQTPPITEGLHGLQAMNTEPWPCDGQIRNWYWMNPFGKAIKIVVVRQWIGLDYYLESDTHVESHVIDASRNQVEFLTIQQLDNYTQRSFEQERWVSFSPSYVEVPADGGIQVQGRCNTIKGGANAHVLMQIWFN